MVYLQRFILTKSKVISLNPKSLVTLNSSYRFTIHRLQFLEYLQPHAVNKHNTGLVRSGKGGEKPGCWALKRQVSACPISLASINLNGPITVHPLELHPYRRTSTHTQPHSHTHTLASVIITVATRGRFAGENSINNVSTGRCSFYLLQRNYGSEDN